jgi:hypothetical protein
MGLMSKSVFEGYSDRIAAQYSYLKTAFDTLASVSGVANYFTRVTGNTDPDMILPLSQPANNADIYFAQNPLNATIASMTNLTGLMTAFTSHVQRSTLTNKTWDGYCDYVGATVSDYTNKVYFARYNSYMKASHVFSEDDITLASKVEPSDAVAGTVLGTGATSELADGTKFAATQIKIKIVGTQNILNGVTVDIVGKDASNVTKTMTAVAVEGNVGDEIVVGTTSDKWLAVTGLTLNGALSGDAIEIHNVKDRIIAL